MIKKALHYLLALCLLTPGIAAFGQASTNSTITGVGSGGSSFNAAAPGPIGGTTPAAGTFTSLTDTGLTATRIPFAGTGGLLGDSANLTFDGTSLSLASASALKFSTDSGISRLGAASLAVGNGSANDFSGSLTLAQTNFGSANYSINNSFSNGLIFNSGGNTWAYLPVTGFQVGPQLQISSTQPVYNGPWVYIGNAGTGNIRLGQADAAAPVAQTLSVQNVVTSTSNTAGVDWTFKASAGTGTGAGGKYIWQVAKAGSTGSTPNTFSTAMSLDSAGLLTLQGNITRTDGTALQLINTSNNIVLNASGGTNLNIGATSISFQTTGVFDIGFANNGLKRIWMDYTNTGTVGAVTINKAAGRVNIAAAGTTVTVTNSLVTAASKVFATIATNDTTALLKNIVPAAGSFVITLNAATTAQTAIDFFVVNTD